VNRLSSRGRGKKKAGRGWKRGKKLQHPHPILTGLITFSVAWVVKGWLTKAALAPQKQSLQVSPSLPARRICFKLNIFIHGLKSIVLCFVYTLFIILSTWLFFYLLFYHYLCHAFYTRDPGSDTEGNLFPRTTFRNLKRAFLPNVTIGFSCNTVNFGLNGN